MNARVIDQKVRMSVSRNSGMFQSELMSNMVCSVCWLGISGCHQWKQLNLGVQQDQLMMVTCPTDRLESDISLTDSGKRVHVADGCSSHWCIRNRVNGASFMVLNRASCSGLENGYLGDVQLIKNINISTLYQCMRTESLHLKPLMFNGLYPLLDIPGLCLQKKGQMFLDKRGGPIDSDVDTWVGGKMKQHTCKLTRRHGTENWHHNVFRSLEFLDSILAYRYHSHV